MKSDLKCYVSAPASFDLTGIEAILDRQNVVHHSFYDFSIGSTFADLIRRKIVESDFIIAVLKGDGDNVLFELGVAEGLKKPVFVLIDKAIKVPFFLDTKLYYQTTFDDLLLIDLALANFISDLGVKKKDKPKNKKDKLTISEVNDILIDISNLRRAPSESNLMNIVKEVFSKLDIENASMESQSFGRGADFIIRSKALKPYFGNPIFIEVKSGNMSANRILDAQAQLLGYIANTEAKGGIILYFDKNNRRFDNIPSLSPSILAFDLEDFVNGIASNGFERFLINERNKLAHGIK